MNISILIPLVFFSFSSMASGEKKYSEEEIEKEVNKRVVEKLKTLESGEIVRFSKELLKKQTDLKILAMDLEKKKLQLAISAKELEKKIQEFSKSQKKFLGCIEDMDKKKSNRITHLVDVVSSMRPAAAAGVLSVQDSEISVEILGRLPAAKVSKIFNTMDKEISARLQKQYMNMKE